MRAKRAKGAEVPEGNGSQTHKRHTRAMGTLPEFGVEKRVKRLLLNGGQQRLV